ncbi:oxygen-dependent coproporphyrinogen oxidase [Parasphingorhabdus cellanae]|uniref:coproporphyrinogen oxidase n=1 Tax=Parasphingorhabdus cellanae TaxID=2806553 RepID=A0ABX7T4Q8_9SPHN|nr:oxygen-dependent coproporphyrinogen oxidase [Parasphingorhabdus cellanae]QTD56521.1 oxygen-dependent coproporphyrinogen oxidase [Parasphingorhabdus cellanae]
MTVQPPIRKNEKPLDDQQSRAQTWFGELRDQICAEFEAIEVEADSDARFEYLPWDRKNPDGSPGGGGVRGVIKGKVFEKAGVNISTVDGTFSEEFAKSIHGAAENPHFFATGISLVAHMANPHVPAVHMNTRFLCTTKRWFGGGADLNPPIPYEKDTADFHTRMKQACDAHDPAYHEKYKKWADDYFYIPHRQVHRGVGGIFYDHLELESDDDFDKHFALTQDVGRAFLDIFPKLVRRRMGLPWNHEEKEQQLAWRGRYAEFNLVYDRGTTFGLKTGGNVDAILMSLPPEAKWS